MLGELNNTFFTQFGKYFSSQHIKKNAAIPFKDHSQFPIIIDTLSRKDNHHILFRVEFSSRMYSAFLEALLFNLAQENIPYPLQNAELLYFDIENLSFIDSEKKLIEKDFHDLKRRLDFSDKNLLIALANSDLLSQNNDNEDTFLRRQFEKLLTHPKCRLLMFAHTNDYLQPNRLMRLVVCLQIAGPAESDLTAILKHQRTELENFHHVLIPEELLSYAYSLSERYLSNTETLEKTLLLLDSSAARAGTVERIENTNQIKPALTTNILINVLSGWTQIPATHLQLHKFRLSEFSQGMQQRIFGQDAAITMLGQGLQQAQAHLQHNTGPFCSLLFVGPEHSGKKTAALALAEQLFKNLHVLYIAQLSSKQNSIFEIKLQRCTDKQFFTLKKLIRQTPYAMIMIEDIHQAAGPLLDELQEIFSTGLLHDNDGTQYNFRQAIIILSTTLGTHRLTTLAKSLNSTEETQPVDLMQLIMNEQQHETLAAGNHYTPQEMVDEIMPEISAHFPVSLYEHVHVVPFLSLNKTAVEQIICLKFKLLNKMLDSRYGVELGYAPEVIRSQPMKYDNSFFGRTRRVEFNAG